jgi:hypothetical protein
MMRATPMEKLPDHLRNLVGFRFFLESPENSRDQTLQPGSEMYHKALNDLCRDIGRMLKALDTGAAT